MHVPQEEKSHEVAYSCDVVVFSPYPVSTEVKKRFAVINSITSTTSLFGAYFNNCRHLSISSCIYYVSVWWSDNLKRRFMLITGDFLTKFIRLRWFWQLFGCNGAEPCPDECLIWMEFLRHLSSQKRPWQSLIIKGQKYNGSLGAAVVVFRFFIVI